MAMPKAKYRKYHHNAGHANMFCSGNLFVSKNRLEQQRPNFTQVPYLPGGGGRGGGPLLP
jgi:hypothetical protein